MSQFTLPDGKVLSFDKPVSGRDVALAIGPGLAKKAIAVKLDGSEIRDLDRIIERDAKISIITATNENPDALHVLRHSAAHVLAEAICSFYPKTRLAYGPSTLVCKRVTQHLVQTAPSKVGKMARRVYNRAGRCARQNGRKAHVPRGETLQPGLTLLTRQASARARPR